MKKSFLQTGVYWKIGVFARSVVISVQDDFASSSINCWLRAKGSKTLRSWLRSDWKLSFVPVTKLATPKSVVKSLERLSLQKRCLAWQLANWGVRHNASILHYMDCLLHHFGKLDGYLPGQMCCLGLNRQSWTRGNWSSQQDRARLTKDHPLQGRQASPNNVPDTENNHSFHMAKI